LQIVLYFLKVFLSWSLLTVGMKFKHIHFYFYACKYNFGCGYATWLGRHIYPGQRAEYKFGFASGQTEGSSLRISWPVNHTRNMTRAQL
jgi:hypothetical protein